PGSAGGGGRRGSPSGCGRGATAWQAVASLVGGVSVRLTVFAMELVNAAAFVAVAVLLYRHAAPGDRARAALLWAANPLVLYHLAAGMHVDTLAVACVKIGRASCRERVESSGGAVCQKQEK